MPNTTTRMWPSNESADASRNIHRFQNLSAGGVIISVPLVVKGAVASVAAKQDSLINEKIGMANLLPGVFPIHPDSFDVVSGFGQHVEHVLVASTEIRAHHRFLQHECDEEM